MLFFVNPLCPGHHNPTHHLNTKNWGHLLLRPIYPKLKRDRGVNPNYFKPILVPQLLSNCLPESEKRLSDKDTSLPLITRNPFDTLESMRKGSVKKSLTLFVPDRLWTTPSPIKTSMPTTKRTLLIIQNNKEQGEMVFPRSRRMKLPRRYCLCEIIEILTLNKIVY